MKYLIKPASWFADTTCRGGSIKKIPCQDASKKIKTEDKLIQIPFQEVPHNQGVEGLKN